MPGLTQERRALLVGVQQYDKSVSAVFPDLQGPDNDIALMYETLRDTFGRDMKIAVLGAAFDAPPTRRAILGALDRLAEDTTLGDEIILYLSGHGTQLPTPKTDSDEPDGLDEVFLPADTKIVPTETGYGITNHIRDTEIGLRIDRMQQAGAFVWLIVDSCHAGTMLRSETAALTPRMANLSELPGGPIADLNPPLSPGQSAYHVLGGTADGKSPQTRFVGFYAAAPEQLAFEMPTGPQANQIHGLFTISLAEALHAAQGLHFADLARETSARMWARAGPRVQAMYRGALDRPLIAAGIPTSGKSGFSVRFNGKTLMSDAGRLHGLTPGTQLAIEMGTGTKRTHVLTAQVTSSALDHAVLEILPDTVDTPNNLKDILATEGLAETGFADRWLADRAPNLTARLLDAASQSPLSLSFGAQVPPDVTQVLVQAATAPGAAFQLTTKEDADLVLDAYANTLALAPGGNKTLRQQRPLRLVSENTRGDALVQLLTRIGKAQRLLQTASVSATEKMPNALRLQVFRQSATTIDDTGTCPAFNGGIQDAIPPTARPVIPDARATTTLHHCDQIFLQVENISEVSLDVSPLYVAADGTIYYLSGYLHGTRQGVRIPPRASRVIRFTESVSPAHAGRHATLLFLAVPAKNEVAKSFRYLATDALQTQNAPPSTRSAPIHSDAPDLSYAAVAWQFFSGNHEAWEAVQQ
ncbi:MAG: caspase domain-containing protein [Roseobacter sp.]